MESSSPANAHVPSAAKQIAAKIPRVKSRPSRPMFQTRFSRSHSSSPPYASRNRLLFRVPDSIAKRHPSKLVSRSRTPHLHVNPRAWLHGKLLVALLAQKLIQIGRATSPYGCILPYATASESVA